MQYRTTFQWLLPIVLSAACADSAKLEKKSPRTVGAVELLPGDPEAPDVAADAQVTSLTTEEKAALCDWAASLKRPDLHDCPDGYYSKHALDLVCRTMHATCAATVEDVAACAVAIADCSVTDQARGGCAPVHAPSCRPEVPEGGYGAAQLR